MFNRNKKSFIRNNHKGFTLAEVLITLVIIGIIAAITIPLIYTDYQKKQTVTKLKKVYSTLSLALQKSYFEQGIPDSPVSLGIDTYFKKYWVPYLNILKYCTSYSECGYQSSSDWKYINNSGHPTIANQSLGRDFLLSDGTYVQIRMFAYDSTNLVNTNIIHVDLNGPKKPNRFGRDVFMFQRKDDETGSYIVCGGNNLTNEEVNENCSKSGRGTACCSRIMRNNWEIAKDYPW